jgi:thiosulfate/3-mercaptopyruvate sulfurtransferase
MADYAHPEVLVSTDWVAAHADDPSVRLIEVDVDQRVYAQGHIRNALGWCWQMHLCDTIRRNLLNPFQFQKLCGEAGITRNTTVVFYGDQNNWFAAYAFWHMKYYGHPDVRLMNGGCHKWEEEGRPYTGAVPAFPATRYHAFTADETIRARRELIFSFLDTHHSLLVDVRSPEEYAGKVIAPPGMTETAQRAGHIPGAINIPWSETVREDGTFKSHDELLALYASRGTPADREVITYCRIGERSSHTWFMLKYLLGFDKVRNYDGGWTEWGNLIDAPIGREVAEMVPQFVPVRGSASPC